MIGKKQLKENKAKNIINSIKNQIENIKNEFIIIRDLSQKGSLGFDEIAKRFDGTVSIENVEHTDSNGTFMMKAIRVCSKISSRIILYDILYGSNGIIIKIGMNQYKKGLFFVSFSDFNCENLVKVIYNEYKLTVIKSYNIDINSDGSVKGEVETVDRPNKSFLGRLLSKSK